MPLGYKYAEREADSYVDWSAIGKGLTDVLNTEAQIRRDKIKTIEDQNIEDINTLENAPQGQFQDANTFTNNFAHDMKAQTIIDKRLLEKGLLSERQYTLKRQNRLNGTNTIFDLQKKYQEVFDKRMEGIQSGDLQALNIANLKMIEQFKDFSQSKAIINPLDGTVNIGMMAPNPKTGVLELTKDVMPVSVAMGKISTEIKAFKVDDAINKSVAAFGDRKDAIYEAATITGAGTITELTGIDALNKYPKIARFQNAITEFNKAVDGTIAGYFSNKYNLSSVLTQNLGKYNEDSYTYDKAEADKDPSKILLKIDKGTQLPVLDESSKNFSAQKKEAEGWVRNQIMNRLDSERKVSTTAQSSQLRGEEEWQAKRRDEKQDASNLAEQIGNIIKGSSTDVTGALKYFAGLGVPIRRTTKAIFVTQKQADGTTKEIPYYFSESGKLANPLKFGKSLISAVNAKGVREDYVADELKRFINPNTAINTVSQGSGYARTRDVKTAFAQKVNNEIATPDLFLKKDKFATIAELKKRLSGVKGLTIESVPSTSYSLTGGRSGNDIVIKYGKDVVNINSNQDNETDANQQKNNIVDFLQKLPENIQEQFLGPDTQEQESRAVEEAGGLGSKY